MSQKRQQEEGKVRSEGGTPEDKRRKFRNVVHEVMRRKSIQRLLEPAIEPLLRRVVKEEVETALRKHLNNVKWVCDKETRASQARSLQLKFLNNLSLPIFTSARIEAEESPDLRIGLVEPLTGQIINSGPESSAKVEIVVLEGDFDGDERWNWTAEDFKNNIVRERDGKKPLLIGDVFVVLKEGVGTFGEISFTDNSSWTRSRKFRLGARLVDSFVGIEVKEAKTDESFVVRDHRGELYRKHHPPSLADEVWRLEKIGKDGAFHKRLTRENISTVKDFLTLFCVDPARLRHILGTGMSAKMWDITVEHARSCLLDKTMHVYCPGFQNKCGVVFNVVGQVKGLLRDCQYTPADKLSGIEKAEAQKLIVAALGQWDEVISYDDEASLLRGFSGLNNQAYASSSPGTAISGGTQRLAREIIGGFGHPQQLDGLTEILPPVWPFGGASSLNEFAIYSIENMDLRYDQTTTYPCQLGDSFVETVSQALCGDYNLGLFTTGSSQTVGIDPQADLQSAVDGFILQQHTTAVAVDKAQRRWTKLFSVLKWFSIRKVVALKRTRVRELERHHNGR